MNANHTNTKGAQELRAVAGELVTYVVRQFFREFRVAAAIYGLNCSSGTDFLNAVIDLPRFRERFPYLLDFVRHYKRQGYRTTIFSDEALWREVCTLADHRKELEIGEKGPVPLPPGLDRDDASVALETNACVRRAAEERTRKDGEDG